MSRTRDRLGYIIAYLEGNRNIVLIIDEAQKLRPDGLEVLRDIHDCSDPDGRRNTTICFFGDQDFYKLIVRARNGERSPIKPQMSRRMYPLIDLAAQGVQDGSGGMYTVEDVVKILRNNRLKLVDSAGIRWLSTLANTAGFGAIGFALATLRMAADISSNQPIGVADLQQALKMLIGPRAVHECDTQSGGLLLKVG